MRYRDIVEAFDNPYKSKWEKSEYGDVDASTKLPDGTYLNIMFNQEYDGEGDEVIHVEFHRNNSQDVTGEGDAQRIFATVLDAIQKYIKKYKPEKLTFSASKSVDMDADDVEQFNPESRAKLYTRLVQRYAGAWGYQAQVDDEGDVVIYQLTRTMVSETSRNVVDFPIANVRRPNGAIGTQGVTTNQVADVLTHIAGIQVSPDMDMRSLVDALKANPQAQQRLRQSLQQNPIHVQSLPDGTYHLKDGHHRTFLLNLLGDQTVPAIVEGQQDMAENFHDGRNPQDKGDSKRYGVPTKASISTLRKVAKQGGRKGQLAHWMANMKSGRAKAKRK